MPDGVELGQVVLTSAGEMDGFSHLLHAAVLDKYDFNPLFLLRLRERTSEETLRKATRGAIEAATAAALGGLVLTPMGAGIGGMKTAKCARIMIDEARATLHELGDRAPKRVVFACFKAKDARLFREELQS